MGCLVIILIFLLIVWINESPGTFVIGLFITGALITWAVISQNSKEREEKEKKNLKDKHDKKLFEDKKQEYNINCDNLIVNYIRGFAKIAKTKYYVWLDKECICLFPSIPQSNEQDYLVYKIPLENIEYYYVQGSSTKETKISGGGGDVGGSSLGGAIAGGIIAGGAGAVIGSRKNGKIEPIKSEIITHDNRETFINYFDEGVKQSIFFDYEDYMTLLKIMPEKEYSNVVKSNLLRGSKSSTIDQIKELGELKEKGILTEEEFSEKKKLLLDKIK